MVVEAGGEQDGSGGRGAGAASRESGGGGRERRERMGASGVVGFAVWTGEGGFRKSSCGRFFVKTTRVFDFFFFRLK